MGAATFVPEARFLYSEARHDLCANTHETAMTKAELRILYLLHKQGAPMMGSKLQAAMYRFGNEERVAALNNLEEFGFISSVKSPPQNVGDRKGGRPSMTYWLTSAGKDQVQELIAKGELGDPANEKRGTRYA